MRRYGMKRRSIHYYQQEAIQHYRYYGRYMQRANLESAQFMQDARSRDIGHAIIALAAVASPEHVKAVLTGTRGRRWSI
jgi:hypothetical protein